MGASAVADIEKVARASGNDLLLSDRSGLAAEEETMVTLNCRERSKNS